MSNFSIGYYRNNKWGDSILDLISDYPEIKEVYFPLPSQHSGRPALIVDADTGEVESELKRNLVEFRKRGLNLNLLLNAGCYADKIQDSSFINNLKRQIIDYVEQYGITSITTTQTSFALMVKQMFGNKVETRASVNIGVASIDAMSYLSDVFDAFYPARELYRSIDELSRWRIWADQNKKRLYALVNSGCLANCPWHTVDNNLVAHGITDYKMADGTKIALCNDYIFKHKYITPILKSNFIRPEDVRHYASFFDGFKIATRDHFLPRLAVRAYLKGYYEGVLTDLLEPGHTHILKPDKCIPNSAFPSDWFSHTSNCHRNCSTCHYCENLAKQISVRYSPEYDFWHYLFDDESILAARLAAKGVRVSV